MREFDAQVCAEDDRRLAAQVCNKTHVSQILGRWQFNERLNAYSLAAGYKPSSPLTPLHTVHWHLPSFTPTFSRPPRQERYVRLQSKLHSLEMRRHWTKLTPKIIRLWYIQPSTPSVNYFFANITGRFVGNRVAQGCWTVLKVWRYC